MMMLLPSGKVHMRNYMLAGCQGNHMTPKEVAAAMEADMRQPNFKPVVTMGNTSDLTPGKCFLLLATTVQGSKTSIYAKVSVVVGTPFVNRGPAGCTKENRCTKCMGDCDTDADCAKGLTCFQRNNNENISGCAMGGQHDVRAHDFCQSGPKTCIGDFNGDLKVAASDLLDLLKVYGLSDPNKKKALLRGPCGGDLSEDGVQDVSDVLVMLQVYGSVYPRNPGCRKCSAS